MSGSEPAAQAEALAREAVQPDLRAGEHVLWAGRPKPGIAFRWIDLLFIPFGFVFTSFAVVWVVAAAMSDVPWFALFGVPFILAGLNLLGGRIVRDARERQRTFVAVTSHRILTVIQPPANGKPPRVVRVVNIDGIRALELDEKADGSGTISLGPTVLEDMDPDGKNAEAPVLRRLENARAAHDAIRDARDALLR